MITIHQRYRRTDGRTDRRTDAIRGQYRSIAAPPYLCHTAWSGILQRLLCLRSCSTRVVCNFNVTVFDTFNRNFAVENLRLSVRKLQLPHPTFLTHDTVGRSNVPGVSSESIFSLYFGCKSCGEGRRDLSPVQRRMRVSRCGLVQSLFNNFHRISFVVMSSAVNQRGSNISSQAGIR